MDENGAFITAIEEDPTCNTRRLIYADWLEEHGAPHEADYLRTELELAKQPLDARDARSLRNCFWEARAAVDPAWLLIFTQPRVLRANPTPFPSSWKNFGLGRLREWKGTYGTWPYDSIPPLPIEELHGEFHYLKTGGPPARAVGEKYAAEYRQRFDRVLADAADKGVRLPEEFVKFMSDITLQTTFQSVTGCNFTLPDEYSPIQANPSGEGTHVHFYCDSQSCVLWDLYVHASGGHCVIARRLDYFDPEPLNASDDQPPSGGPRAWFVAPSFETFLYRVWVENQVWHIEHADFCRRKGQALPPMTLEIRDYINHYRSC